MYVTIGILGNDYQQATAQVGICFPNQLSCWLGKQVRSRPHLSLLDQYSKPAYLYLNKNENILFPILASIPTETEWLKTSAASFTLIFCLVFGFK